MDAALAQRSLRSLADDAAAGAPGVGGGVAAAVATSLAASLVVLVARSSRGTWTDADGVAAQAAARGALAAELGDANVSAYAAAAAALSDDAAGAAGKRPLVVLLEAAAEVPVQIGAVAADVAELAALAARHGAPDRRPDAAIAAILAEAAARAASVLVDVNLGVTAGDERAARARDDLTTAGAAVERAAAMAQ
jgi:glutamate formiminotransferase/formiminotetrahydrofolate cyclodeaminase